MPRVTFEDPGLQLFVMERGAILHVAIKDFMEG